MKNLLHGFELEAQIEILLSRGQDLTAAQLMAATGKSQPTISLALQRLGRKACKLGAARSTMYALTSDIRGLPGQRDLLWLGDRQQHPRDFAHISLLHRNRIHLRGEDFEFLVEGRLPWFLSPLRPQGFLGRAVARMHEDLPSDPEQWSLVQVIWVCMKGWHDPPGAIVVQGDSAVSDRSNWQVSSDTDARIPRYDQLAAAIHQGLPAHSSAGGEQPKFVVHDGQQEWIVKFTPPLGTPFGQRWHALLQLEALALQTLQRHGIACAQTAVLRSVARTYLQSTRFDRAQPGGGRVHVVPIDSLHTEFVTGSRENWVQTSLALLKKGLLDEVQLQQIACIHAFGHFIGNTDMHFGNLSFFADDVIKPSIRLAPVYDMLPMMWRPSIYDGDLSISPVRSQPLPWGFEEQQTLARQWAIEFWTQAQQLDIGADLQAAAKESARRLTTNFAES